MVEPGGGTKVCDLYSDGGIGALVLPVSGDVPRSIGSSCGARGSGIVSGALDGIGFAGVALEFGVVVAVGTGVGVDTGTAIGGATGSVASSVASAAGATGAGAGAGAGSAIGA